MRAPFPPPAPRLSPLAKATRAKSRITEPGSKAKLQTLILLRRAGRSAAFLYGCESQVMSHTSPRTNIHLSQSIGKRAGLSQPCLKQRNRGGRGGRQRSVINLVAETPPRARKDRCERPRHAKKFDRHTTPPCILSFQKTIRLIFRFFAQLMHKHSPPRA